MRTSLRGARMTLGLALLAGGCGDQSVTVGNSDVKGSVGGIILDALPGFPPLGNATITVISGGHSTSVHTDDQGYFSVTGVQAGGVVVKIAADGHAPVYVSRTLDFAAGNFPLANPSLTVGPIAVLGTATPWKVRLVDENGGQAANVKITARSAAAYLDLSSGAAVATGVIEASATTGADGLATVAGLPDFNAIGGLISDAITVSVPPIEVQGATETYAFLGADFSFNGRKAATQTPTIVLAGAHTPLQVLASSLDYLTAGAAFATPSLVNPTGPITVTFNQAINPASVRAIVYNDAGQLPPMVTPQWTTVANVVTISFSSGKPLDAGTRYNLQLHAQSLSDQAKDYTQLAPFFTQLADKNAMVTISNGSHFDTQNQNDYVVVFSEPVGIGFGSAANVACTVFYEADLDGNSQVTSPGEWNPNGNSALKCSPNDPHLGYYLRPDEATGFPAPQTGFAQRWRLAAKAYGNMCVGNYQCCAGTATVHFQFSRNPDPATVMRRLNGQPLPDMSFILPQYNCP